MTLNVSPNLCETVLERQRPMSTQNDETSKEWNVAPQRRTRILIDRSRNERQKATLLTHLASMRTGSAQPGNVEKDTPPMQSITHEDLRTQHFRFLRTELDLGTTFANIALQKASNQQKKQRNHVNARKAYDTVLQHLHSMALTAGEAKELDEKLSMLREHLLTLGENL